MSRLDPPYEQDSLPAITGRAWVFGDAVTEEQILAAEHWGDGAAAARFVFAAVDPRFAVEVQAGDFVVAGVAFAGNATQPTVPAALQQAGIAAVIARSFGAAFERNAIHRGLPALVVEETAAVHGGDRLRVDVEAHVIANLSSGDRYVIRNIDDRALAILRAGGLAEYARRRHPR